MYSSLPFSICLFIPVFIPTAEWNRIGPRQWFIHIFKDCLPCFNSLHDPLGPQTPPATLLTTFCSILFCCHSASRSPPHNKLIWMKMDKWLVVIAFVTVLFPTHPTDPESNSSSPGHVSTFSRLIYPCAPYVARGAPVTSCFAAVPLFLEWVVVVRMNGAFNCSLCILAGGCSVLERAVPMETPSRSYAMFVYAPFAERRIGKWTDWEGEGGF